jgi:protein SCO1/2
MRRSYRIIVLAALAIGAAAAGVAAGVWYTQAGTPEAHAATVLDAPRPLPELSLLDERGAPVTLEDLRGHWTLLFFGFTQCPDVCPMTLQVLAHALRSQDDLPQAQRAVARFVTVDPERDTPQALSRYLATFDADIHGLTGSPAAIDGLARALGVAYGRVDRPDGGGYTMDHTAALFLLDPQARFVAVFTPPHDARAIAADLRAIARRGPS